MTTVAPDRHARRASTPRVLTARAARAASVAALGGLLAAPARAQEGQAPIAVPAHSEGSGAPTQAEDPPHPEPVQVLFVVVVANSPDGGAPYAVPIACVDAAHRLVTTPEACVDAWSGPGLLVGTSTGLQIAAEPVRAPIFDRDSTGIALDTTPDDRLLWLGAASTPAARPLECAASTHTRAVPPMTPTALAASGAGGEVLAGATAFLGAAWAADAALEADIDGDGLTDRLSAGEFANDAAPGGDCFVLVAEWGADPHNPTLVDLTCEDPTTGVLSEGGGPFNLEDSSCWDLNADHTAELWLSTGYDSMREYAFVVVQGGRLERAGGAYWFGD